MAARLTRLALDRVINRRPDSRSIETAPDTAGLTDAFAAHLITNASRYYPDFSHDVDVRLQRRIDRPVSTLYEFTLSDKRATRPVLVKLPRAPAVKASDIGSAQHDRPRRVSVPPPTQRTRLEFEALGRLHDYFGALNDSRFGSIRPLDLIAPPGAIVMEKACDPRLSHLLLRPQWLVTRTTIDFRRTALRNAGAWLAAWHRYPSVARREETMATLEEFVEFTSLLTDYLSATIGGRGLFSRARAITREAACRILPAQLPLGISHNDYAPRNVLVAAGGQITVLDTLARHRAPIYVDLAHFLMSLECAGAQVRTAGLWFSPGVIEDWKRSFLDGYGRGSRAALDAIKLFEIQMVLDKWASVTLRTRLAGSGLLNRQRNRAWSVFLERYLRRLLTAV